MKDIIVSIFGAFCLLSYSEGSIVQPVINGASAALIYLSRFGYIDQSVTNTETGSLMAQEKVSEAIMEFQAFAGLNQTGLLDEETVKMMNTPRCGVVDKVGYGSNARRKKRYALQGSRWKVNDLTYKVTKYPKGSLTKGEVDYDVMKAFKVWSDVSELTFTPATSGKVHIEIRFEKGEHGDGDAFDGIGGTLAHAYFPIYGGDAHFDDSELWTVNSFRGTNLFQVAAHEFGHSLGLSHSDVQASLMAPFYRGYQSTFSLNNDDISAIQSLYGHKTPLPSRPTKPSRPSGSDSTLCKDGSIDAIVSMADNKTYIFKGSQFWELVDDGVAKGYPKKISGTFYGLPSDLDAAFTWKNGKTYFFKGSEYWRFSDFSMDEDDYPKPISKGFQGIPSDVDAAFVWSGNGKIYFFKGTDYYKFDPEQRPPVSAKYPKDLKAWEGLPYYIDDALQYSNGYTYFFKKGKYWRFNDRGFKVDTADPPFPRLTGPWWFGCPSKDSQVESTTHRTNANAIPDTDVNNDDSYYTDGAFYDDYNDDTNSDINPNIEASMSDGHHGNGVSRQRSGKLAWLLIPLVFRIICL